MSSFDVFNGGVNFNPTTQGPGFLGTQAANYGDNEFLALVTAQLVNQSPLQPVDNDAFTEQLAMYSSIEQQTELNDNLLDLLDFQGLLARLQGINESSNLLGKEVSWMEGNNEVKGVVESVQVTELGEVQLQTTNGSLDMRSVIGIAEPDTGSSSSSGSEETNSSTDA